MQARSNPQSARFHAICGEVARQATFQGRRLSAQQWKVLFCSAWFMVHGEELYLARGLECEFVLLRPSTAKMNGEAMSSLIEYCTAWAISNGFTLAK